MAWKLRIGVSVFFGVLAVALCALWVWSLTHVDVAGVAPRTGYLLAITSSRGAIELSHERLRANMAGPRGISTYSMYLPKFEHEGRAILGNFRWTTTPNGNRVQSPIWLFLMLATGLATAPWLTLRFSLRTLLVAMTLIASVLGLAVWAGR